jgi:hypothetical protein
MHSMHDGHAHAWGGVTHGEAAHPPPAPPPSSFITVPLCKKILFISRSCRILVLTTVLGLPRRADVKNVVKNDQGPTISRENAILK